MNVVLCDLPLNIKGMTVRTFDGDEVFLTIVLNARHSYETQLEAYRHEVDHIENNDFDRRDVSVGELEMRRHG